MTESVQTIRIGTRGSALAMWQARHVASLLKETKPDIQTEIIPISTVGDTDKVTPLSELGGKGVFIRGLEDALIQNQIDIAVHSLKDVTAQSLAGLDFFAFLTPESIQDAVVTKIGVNNTVDPLGNFPQGGRIGTGSLRRIALLRQHRPDLQTIPIRGNIETRMQKVLSGELDGILLSEAGLKRMGVLPGLQSHVLSPQNFVPAPGQGVIVVQGRSQDCSLNNILSTLSDPIQSAISQTQLSLLTLLGFDCKDPFGIWSYPSEKGLSHLVFLETATKEGRYYDFHTQIPATDLELQTWIASVANNKQH